MNADIQTLTRVGVGGEVEAGDLARAVAQDADQLALIGDAWFEPADGVGVHVARDGDLVPTLVAVFLRGRREDEFSAVVKNPTMIEGLPGILSIFPN